MKIISLVILTFILTNTSLLAQEANPVQNVLPVEEARGLLPGIKAPLFTALDLDSMNYSLEEALETGPVVLIFYRGHWCPYCNKHLARIQDSLQLIYNTGASVVAVSPQKPDYLTLTKQKTGASFSLLFDKDYSIANDYDVTFTPESKQLFTYNRILMANLKKSQSDDTQRLPVPATYLISQEGIIVWGQFDPDYKNRSSVKEILKALSELN